MFARATSFLLFITCVAFNPEIGPPGEAVARSLLNVTDYIGDYIAGDPFLGGAPASQPVDQSMSQPMGLGAGLPGGTLATGEFVGPMVPFDPSARHLCQVKAGNARRLHLVHGMSENFQLTGNAAFILDMDIDAPTAGLQGRTRAIMDKWDAQTNGMLKEQYTRMRTFQQAEEEARAGAHASYQLGKVGMTAPLGDRRFVILTGGTSEDKSLVPNGDKYFALLADSYTNVLTALHNASVKDAILEPFGLGKQFQPDWVIDKDVLVFYAGNMLSYHISEEGTLDPTSPLSDVYLVGNEQEVVYSMCKYCQYRTLRTIGEIAGGYCAMIRSQVEAARSSAFSTSLIFSVLTSMLAFW